MAKVWPSYSSITRPPPELYLHQRGYGPINKLVVGSLQGRQATEAESIARIRQRFTDAFGSYYQERIVADAQSGRGRFVSQVGQ